MKKIYLSIVVFILTCAHSYSGTFTILSTPSFTFDPDSISVNLHDTVLFSLASFHFVTEVDQSTWNNNQSTSNGGFSTPNGGGQVVLDQIKTYYYVCGVHFGLGMKGRIFVTDPNGIVSPSTPNFNFTISMDPSNRRAIVDIDLPVAKEKELNLFDLSGKCFLKKDKFEAQEILNLSDVPAGVYFIEIVANGVRMQKKFVVPN